MLGSVVFGVCGLLLFTLLLFTLFLLRRSTLPMLLLCLFTLLLLHLFILLRLIQQWLEKKRMTTHQSTGKQSRLKLLNFNVAIVAHDTTNIILRRTTEGLKITPHEEAHLR